ncbi:MAG TPA: PrgI family protein [Candidatus Saccharimonadales bacterium]|nr:PrgI family protein [Candidatus Saccharimonadales bacterium]
MATYKLIQDIEAEDHILGPLTLRQFIYALVAAFTFYLSFICVAKGVPILLIIFLPPALICAFFAFPFGKDQPTEVWALAKIRFLFKPRRRVWSQSGVKEMVTITAPPKVERNLTKNLDQTQVQSRLAALANTIDSRGWAVKNVNVNMYSQPDPVAASGSDRLLNAPDMMPQEVPNFDIGAADDMMDENNNRVAAQFDQMITASSEAHHQELLDGMNNVRQLLNNPPVATTPAAPAPGAAPAGASNDYWFLSQPSAAIPAGQTTFGSSPVVAPGSATVKAHDEAAEATAEAELKAHQAAGNPSPYGHLHTLQPADPQPVASPVATVPTDASTTGMPSSDPAILNLANNNDLNVATLAREAEKNKQGEPPADEVVISLH